MVVCTSLCRKFPMHFDEDVMFKDKDSRALKKEFVDRFLNVTRIIDCVTCEKCRLWGKLQVSSKRLVVHQCYCWIKIFVYFELLPSSIILLEQGPQTFLSEGHTSCYTTFRGPDILRNVVVSGYVTFYQINAYFSTCYFFIMDKMSSRVVVWIPLY